MWPQRSATGLGFQPRPAMRASASQAAGAVAEEVVARRKVASARSDLMVESARPHCSAVGADVTFSPHSAATPDAPPCAIHRVHRCSFCAGVRVMGKSEGSATAIRVAGEAGKSVSNVRSACV